MITFFSFEQALVGIYERDKEANTMQLSEVLGNAESALTNCGNFVLALDYHPEPNIKTWDRVQADNIKRYLFLIKKSEAELNMIQSSYADPSVVQKKEQVAGELKKFLFQFESLYVLYDTEIVATVLENIVKEASFEAKDYPTRIADHREFEQEIDKYLKNLKTLAPNPELPVNIARMFNDRIRVLNEVKLIYELLFKIYRDIMTTPYPKDLEKRQLSLKDRQLLQYLALLTRAAKDLKNNSTAISQEVALTVETKNFLRDVIEEFITNFELFFKVNEVELESYTRLMGLGQDFSNYADEAIIGFQKTVDSPIDPEWSQRVISAARQVAEINADVQDLYRLENGKLGKIAFGNLKDDVKKRAEWFALTDTLIQESEANRIELKTSFKDSKVEQIRKKLLVQLASMQ